MIKERINMVLRPRIFVIISVSSLILYLSIEGLNILPSIAQSNFKFDEANQQVGKGRVVDEAKEPAPAPLFGPVLSLEQPKETPRRVKAKLRSPLDSLGLGETLTAAASSSIIPVSEISSCPEGMPPTMAEGPNSPSSSPSPAPFSLLPESQISSVPEMAADGGDAEAPVSNPASGPGPSGFLDQDIALAIEARIKQSQTDSQIAMDEAKKLLEDPDIASSETGMCLSKCVDKYGASLNELNRAVTDLGVRDVSLLADDFAAVEMDILTCQACFTDNFGEDSPFKALDEATTKAARECLTVMDYAV
ncbi:hypothetical protein L2E82_19794 [Cichorium intybus]|uniref:Uncharacterized protein n=1 Tax=Cichorium intybus TaxID=13427 RepID=A0ACB9DSC4_CICIN|nr:hypothetical protein L2E82_19794 [Cichorium intybus]